MLKLNVSKNDLLLYIVTDRTWLNGDTLSSHVEKAILGGATFVQIREKDIKIEEFVNISKEIKKITDKYNIPLVINDNIEVAKKINADGVHVGQSDINAKECREILGSDKILGVSVQTVNQAILAQESGADYIGVGAVFKTQTKSNADNVSLDELKNICDAVSIPVVAIGGINKKNIDKLIGVKICGVALVSEIFSAKDIKKEAEIMLNLSKEIVG